MKVIDHLSKTDRTLFSIEVLPPLKGASINSIYDAVDPLMEFKPISINVTYHREEYIDKKMPGGLIQRVSVRKRPGTVGIAAALGNRYGVDPVPHLICGGFTREETENALIDLDFLGIKNVLALRGDAMNNERVFVPEEDGNNYALDLIRQIADMNKGKYLYDDVKDLTPTDFCIGVAGYPEKHFEAPNMEFDLKNLKNKVDAGGEYIVTQMFFDNKRFFEFERRCRELGITVPIVPGIKLLTTKRQLSLLPTYFHTDIPDDLVKEAEKCTDNAGVAQVGIEWGIQQCKELMAHGAPCLHFYTMGRGRGTREVAEAIY